MLVNEVCAASPSNAIIGFYEARHLIHENASECAGRDSANQQFERTRLRKTAPSWSAFDIRMMFEGYLERGFIAEDGDVETLTKLLGHAPRPYEDFARETLLKWQEMPMAA